MFESVIDDLESVILNWGGEVPSAQHELPREKFEDVEMFARKLLDASVELPSGKDSDFIQEIVRLREKHPQSATDSKGLFGYALDRAQQQLAFDWLNAVKESLGRILQLAFMARPATASNPARRLFECVGRCYLHGFDREGIIMCRSLMEAELESEIPRDDCNSFPPQGNVPKFGLAHRIQVAAKTRRLSYNAAESAHSVREAGNAAVHPSANRIDKFDVILQKTLDVLLELDRTRN